MDKHVSQKIELFFTQFKYQQYKKGEIIVRAGDEPSGIFYLKEGLIKKYAISQKGDEVVINIFKPISFFPMSWAINSSPNHYYYEALADVVVWKAPKDKVIAFIRQEPDILYDLLLRVYKGTEGMETRMISLMAGNANARLMTELIIQAKRFGKKEQEGIITLTVSEKELAASSGMTRETVSREMKKLKENGVVALYKNKIILKNVEKLERKLVHDV